jgi:outer membrane beta-barrel protein
MAAIALGLALVTLAGPGLAQEGTGLMEEQRLRSMAVQQRRLHHHEFNASFGLLPVDAFLKGLAASASYTIHFNHLFAWEVGHFYYVLGRHETDLNDDLNNVGLPNPFKYVQWAATTNLVFTPLYGKFGVLNRSQVFLEAFLVFGGGYGWLTPAEGEGHSQHAVFDAGLGGRMYLKHYFSLRVDVRWAGFFFNVEEPHHELWIAFGASFHFG